MAAVLLALLGQDAELGGTGEGGEGEDPLVDLYLGFLEILQYLALVGLGEEVLVPALDDVAGVASLVEVGGL